VHLPGFYVVLCCAASLFEVEAIRSGKKILYCTVQVFVYVDADIATTSGRSAGRRESLDPDAGHGCGLCTPTNAFSHDEACTVCATVASAWYSGWVDGPT